MLPKKVQKALKSFEREIRRGLFKNQGKYSKYTYVGDLHDWLEIIYLLNKDNECNSLIENNNINKAWNAIRDLDTAARDTIPNCIYNYVQNKEGTQKEYD